MIASCAVRFLNLGIGGSRVFIPYAGREVAERDRVEVENVDDSPPWPFDRNGPLDNAHVGTLMLRVNRIGVEIAQSAFGIRLGRDDCHQGDHRGKHGDKGTHGTSRWKRIERIVFHGHSSPEGFWYDQEQNEWVVVLK